MREKLSKIGVNIPELSKKNLEKYLPVAVVTAMLAALTAIEPGAAFVTWQTAMQDQENRRNAETFSENSDQS